MHTNLELTLKGCYFGSIHFPLNSASKANKQPTNLLPTRQPLTKRSVYTHCIRTLHMRTRTLQQAAHNITPRSA